MKMKFPGNVETLQSMVMLTGMPVNGAKAKITINILLNTGAVLN